MAASDATVSWIAGTDDAVRFAKNVIEAQRQIADLEEAKASLSKLVVTFRELSQGAVIVRSFGWEGRWPSPELARSLTDAASTLDSRPLNRTIRELERFKTEVASDLADCWARHAAEQIGDTSELLVLARTLSIVDGLGELSAQLEATLGELARVQRAVPSRRGLVLLEATEKTLRTLQESLKPDSVRRFLTAVGRGGASTELLNRDVIDWLTSHRALSSFKVVAGSPIDDADV